MCPPRPDPRWPSLSPRRERSDIGTMTQRGGLESGAGAIRSPRSASGVHPTSDRVRRGSAAAVAKRRLVVLLLVASAHPGPAEVVGAVGVHSVVEGESLIELARAYDVGYDEMAAANPGLAPFVPAAGTLVTVPTAWIPPRAAQPGWLIVNLSEMRLYLVGRAGTPLVTFPLGIGIEGTATPLGTYRVVAKEVDPAWHVPPSIKAERPDLPAVVPPGPDNPLGTHALRLSAHNILIHGTNKPWGIGRRVSHGCIRMYPEDIPQLFAWVKVGTNVTIVRQPVKIGVDGRQVYAEVHDEGFTVIECLDEAKRLLQKHRLSGREDPLKLFQAIRERRGYPVVISN